MVEIHNINCFEYLGKLQQEVSAVITDPPYGIGFAAQPTKWQRKAGKQPREWDNKKAENLWDLLEVAPVNAVWGGNYYNLPPSRGWLCWYKPDSPPSMADFELAWTNIDMNSKHITCSISQTNKERVGHPTQKPLKVMRWCIELLTKPGDVVFDPFMGSGTTGVACVELGRSFIGCEIDRAYFEISQQRINEASRQGRLFAAASSANNAMNSDKKGAAQSLLFN